MKQITRLLAATVSAVLLAGGLTVVQAGPAAAAPDNYTPPSGAKFNDPLSDSRRAIYNHLIRSIRSVTRGEEIRIASWNLKSENFVDSLIAAHRRGVSVQVIVSSGNANEENPNPGFFRLKRNLNHDGSRPVERRSWAMLCTSSCRGGSGIAHTKMYLFSKVGNAKNVVMFGSANATEVAATGQWNDLFTVKGKRALYDRSEQIFREMSRDRRAKQPYQTFTVGKFQAIWYPYWYGTRTSGDPTLTELQHTRCKGATGAGAGGRTVVRIGMTAWLSASGEDIANRLKTMWNRGCDVKIVYAVIGNRILKILRDPTGRGAIPMRQIVQDFNGDGVYDRYLHMKVLTVSGVWRGDTSANVTWNGSSNWTPVSLKSDEMGMKIQATGVRRRYANWIEHLFNNPPYNPYARSVSGRTASPGFIDEAPRPADLAPGVNPYAKIEFN
ncbi:phospholipase D-like domain-containing protein [Nocardioides mesophilus]|uniref:phospholipase D n=1 Tax=Nocardioides mesophilus TaxID=433659 RepID=A0A7G9R816_9ACTN|nr:phospholipase D-like domain-containing protein [Nocardioides mesophilus]QNN51741.1 hypothetical protein H9L09_14405 [Nocardioides mesophilus]